MSRNGSATSSSPVMSLPAMSMSEASAMCAQTTCEDMASATSSPASAAGASPCGLPAGPMVDLFGPAPAPASPSARPAKARRPMTSVTCGLRGFLLSPSGALQSSLESRLRRQLDGAGSTLFSLTWKAKATPAHRPYFQLAASARRTSGSECGSWPTPEALNSIGYQVANGKRYYRLGAVASWATPRQADKHKGAHHEAEPRVAGTDLPTMASWATPTQRDWRSDRSRMTGEELYGSKDRPLARQTLSAWPTTQSRDGAHSRSGQIERTGGRRRNLDDYVMLASGPMPTGSGAGTASTGQLNPDHSRWLMGYPAEWGSCAPTATRSRRKPPQSSSPHGKRAGHETPVADLQRI